MKDEAQKLILKNSKVWLCEKLGISRPTLDTRLELNNWKKGEVHLLKLLSK